MPLYKYFSMALGVPYIIMACLVLSLTVYESLDYYSEWLTAESFIFMALIISCANGLIIAVLTSTILLHKVAKIRSHFFVKWSWFLLPIGYILTIYIISIFNMVKQPNTTIFEHCFPIIMNMPFLIGLCFSIYQYRKKGLLLNISV